MNIAFIGLGNMGAPMAQNLLKGGHTVYAFDLSKTALEAAARAGLTAAASAQAAVAQADVVITMLPASRHVEALYLGVDGHPGLLAALRPDQLVIDSSTISASSATKVARAAAEQGITMLDAPVSGGTGGAAAGTLTFMVGGEAEAFEKAKPILSLMGKNLFHAGGAGAGQAAKLCNNMLLGILMVGTSEALALGQANGLDPKVLSEIMRLSSGGNWALEKYNPFPGVMPASPASNEYKGGFGTDLMLKDLGLAMESAQMTGAITPLGTLARNIYALHSRSGKGALDFSSVISQFSKT